MPEYPLSTEAPAANSWGAQAAPQGTSVQDNLARVALLLDQLTKAVVDLRQRMAAAETQLSKLHPYVDAMKIHVDSFPNALREARRSDLTVRRQIEQLSSRMNEMESRLTAKKARIEQLP